MMSELSAAWASEVTEKAPLQAMSTQRIRALVACVGSLLLSGCYTIQGPPQALSARGVAIRAMGERTTASLQTSANLQERFQAAAISGAGGATSDFSAFRNAGFALVYANCNDFFWSMGRQQTKVNIARDAVAPVVTLLTGIIALHDFTNHPKRKENLLQALTIGSAATLAGIEIYQSNFLFGAENIDSVRELTMKALTAHATKAGEAQSTSFEQAAVHIIDNQAICTPSHILSLTKAAISAGTVQAAPSSAPAPAAPTDGKQMLALGALGQVPFGVLTPDQTGALWAVVSGEGGADLWPELYAKLRGLGAQNPLVEVAGVGGAAATYTANPAWDDAKKKAALESVSQLSAATLTGFRSVLAAKRQNAAAPLGDFVIAQTAGQFEHVSVEVKK